MTIESKKTNEKNAKKDGKKEARKLKIVSTKDARKHRNAAKKAKVAAQNAAKKAKLDAQNAAKKAKAAADNEARKAKAAAKKEANKAKNLAQQEANKVKKEAIRAKQEQKANARSARQAQAKAQAKAARAGKKERVIHTRVSQNLERELRESAADLGVSVSNLVRNVLLNTFGLVEGLVVDGARVAHSARGETAPKPPVVQQPVTEDAGSVLGWQAILLNMNALCDQCNAILPKGKEAFVGVLQGTGTKPIRCATCVKAG